MEGTKMGSIKIFIAFLIVILVGYFAFKTFNKTDNQVATPINQVGQELAASKMWHSKGILFPGGAQSEILSVELTYNRDPLSFSVNSLSKYQSFKPQKEKQIKNSNAYKIALVDSTGKVLSEKEIPVTWEGHGEQVVTEGGFTSQDFSLPTSSTTVDFNFDSQATKIKITDSKGKILLDYVITEVVSVSMDNDFSGIRGDDFLSPRNVVNSGQDMTATALLAAKGGNSGGGGGPGGGGSGGGGTITPDTTYDFVIVSDKYTSSEMNTFLQDRDTVVNALLSTQPMKARASQIAFYTINNTKDLKCNGSSGVFTCDVNSVLRVVNGAGVPRDVIIVLSRLEGYGIAGSGGGGLASIRVDHAPIWYSTLGGTAVHEIGHASFNLLDEYQRVATSTQTNSIQTNCYRGTVPPYPSAWADLVAPTEYRLGCYAGNWTAPGGSAMLTPDILRYNTPSQMIVTNALNNIAGVFADAVNPTVSITSPLSGTSVDGNVTVAVSATDNTDIARVKLFVDGVYKYTVHYPGPYNFTFTLPTGVHSIYAQAVDINGNTSTSGTISVTKLADVTAPSITNVVSSYPVGPLAGQTGFRVYWYTSEPATGYVSYGTSPGVYTASSPVVNTSTTTYGMANLTGLIDGTRYYYKVHATDPYGNSSTSPEFSEIAKLLN